MRKPIPQPKIADCEIARLRKGYLEDQSARKYYRKTIPRHLKKLDASITTLWDLLEEHLSLLEVVIFEAFGGQDSDDALSLANERWQRLEEDLAAIVRAIRRPPKKGKPIGSHNLALDNLVRGLMDHWENATREQFTKKHGSQFIFETAKLIEKDERTLRHHLPGIVRKLMSERSRKQKAK